MATSLGKRKRSSVVKARKVTHSEPSTSDTEDLQEVFRRHFEAKFKPLSPAKKSRNDTSAEELEEAEDGDDEGDADSWAGLSASSSPSSQEQYEDGAQGWDEDEDDDDEEDVEDQPLSRGVSMPRNAAVQVIEHTQPLHHQRASKAAMRAFMSSRPPSAAHSSAPPRTQTHGADTHDSDDDATHARHDAALQKLLRESHLLSGRGGGSGPSSGGAALATRHAALDLHLQSLGAAPATALKHQAKMPMGMRRGIERARVEGEARRREEARQLGVVLEREVRGKKDGGKGKEKRRERGVGAPSVGSFRGGTLMLSGRDVRSIRGGGGGRGGARGRGRGRGGRRR